jgi:hypothetical protein
MGDDKYKEIVEKLPQLAAVASEVMSEEVLEVDGVKCIFKVTFRGKLGYVGWVVCVLSIYVHYYVHFHIYCNFFLLLDRRAVKITLSYRSP